MLDRMISHRELSQGFEWHQLGFVMFLNKLEDLLQSSNNTLKDTVVYCDPPYQFATAVYQDSTGAWTLQDDKIPVSYTHLTLPTICSV